MDVEQILLQGLNAWNVIEEFWKKYAILFNYKSKKEMIFIATWVDSTVFNHLLVFTVIIEKQEHNQILITIVSVENRGSDWEINLKVKEVKTFIQKHAIERQVNITFPDFSLKWGTPL